MKNKNWLYILIILVIIVVGVLIFNNVKSSKSVAMIDSSQLTGMVWYDSGSTYGVRVSFNGNSCTVTYTRAGIQYTIQGFPVSTIHGDACNDQNGTIWYPSPSLQTGITGIDALQLNGGIAKVPTVSMGISSTGILNGFIYSDGGATVTARGFIWSTSSTNLTTALTTKSSNGTGVGSFVGPSISTFTKSYYLRAYAVNSKGVAYSSIFSINPTTSTFTYPSASSTVKK